MATFRLSASGYAGGWLHWGSDTPDEVRDSLRAALTAAGYTVSLLDLSWSELDAAARLARNEFPYRVNVTITNAFTTNAATAIEDVRQALRNANGGHEATISNLDAGEAAQADPAIHLPTLPQVNASLGLIAVIVVVIGVVVLKKL